MRLAASVPVDLIDEGERVVLWCVAPTKRTAVAHTRFVCLYCYRAMGR